MVKVLWYFVPKWFKKMGKNQLDTDAEANPIQVGETFSIRDPQ